MRVSTSSFSPKQWVQRFSQSAVLGNSFFSTVLLWNYKNQSNPGSLRQYFGSPMTQNNQSDTMRSITCCSGKPKNEQLQVRSSAVLEIHLQIKTRPESQKKLQTRHWKYINYRCCSEKQQIHKLKLREVVNKRTSLTPIVTHEFWLDRVCTIPT